MEAAGHPADKGSAAATPTVSQRRADAVREILVQAGVPGQIVTAKGYGSSRPVADNATAEGQAANRRVEIRAA
ncbi:OmpA family protein [Mobilicoccus massiliensis]|uniref:OmpA family protein n=1 Tax=Mobilicoccus massiliensis TaxID=1522310 RepID=UPI000BB2FF20